MQVCILDGLFTTKKKNNKKILLKNYDVETEMASAKLLPQSKKESLLHKILQCAAALIFHV